MPFPAPVERIDEAETQLGMVFPEGLRARLARQNGGLLWVGDELWTLFPVWDPTTRRTASRSTSHVVRETTSFREAFEGLGPTHAVPIADDDAGDYLLLVGDPPRSAIWRPGVADLEFVEVDWAQAGPRRPARSGRSEAIARIATVLEQVGRRGDTDTAVVVDAPDTPYFVQFAATAQGFKGEAVGLRSLPRLHVHHAGDAIVGALESLGWRSNGDDDHGNWTRQWDHAAWDPTVAARLVVDTFQRAYALRPEVLVATSMTSPVPSSP